MWVSAWIKQSLNKDVRSQNSDFYCLRLLVNYENWWGGPKDLQLCLYNPLAVSKESKLLHLSGKGHRSAFLMVYASLWQQSWYLRNLMPPNQFAKLLSKSAIFAFFWFHCLIYTYHTWLFASCVLVYTMHWALHSLVLQTVSLQTMNWVFG